LHVVHVLVVTIWFAVPLPFGRILKQGVAGSAEDFKSATDYVGARGKVLGIVSILSLLTGIALVMTMGGFGDAPPAIHAAMGIVVVMIGLGFGVMLPISLKLSKLATNFDDAARTEASALIKRMSMIGRFDHLLWLIVLTLMFIK